MGDLEDYLTEEMKIEIAKEAFRDQCLDKFREDSERIFSNVAYKAVWQIVDEVFDGKAAQVVAEKIPKIIDELSEYSVFRADSFGAGKSVGQKAIDVAVVANQDAINSAVMKAAKSINRDYILDAVLDADFKVSIERS